MKRMTKQQRSNDLFIGSLMTDVETEEWEI